MIQWFMWGHVDPRLTDFSAYTFAPKQACRVFSGERSFFWVLPAQADAFSAQFAEEIATSRFNVVPINIQFLTERLLSRQDILAQLDRTFTNFPILRTMLTPHNLLEAIDWYIHISEKINAKNMIKELLVPLILGTQSMAGNSSHYFDLSVFFDEDQIFSKIVTPDATSLPISPPLGRTLPTWPHPKLPTEPTLGKQDVWWMYSAGTHNSAVFYFNLFFRILGQFLITFPITRAEYERFLQRPIRDGNFQANLETALTTNPNFSLFLKSLFFTTYPYYNLAVFDIPTYLADNPRAHLLIEIFINQLTICVDQFCVLHERLGVDKRTLSCIWVPYQYSVDKPLQDMTKQYLTQLTRTASTHFINRFFNVEAAFWFCPELNCHKSILGNWKIASRLGLGETEQENLTECKRIIEQQALTARAQQPRTRLTLNRGPKPPPKAK